MNQLFCRESVLKIFTMALFWTRFLKATLFALKFMYLETQSQSASFYFTVHENLGFYKNHHSRSVQTGDIMSCAQTCGRDSTCATANYDEVRKRCYLSDQRTRNILEESNLVLSINRFYLIEKVRVCLFGTKDKYQNKIRTNLVQRGEREFILYMETKRGSRLQNGHLLV